MLMAAGAVCLCFPCTSLSPSVLVVSGGFSCGVGQGFFLAVFCPVSELFQWGRRSCCDPLSTR
ncbi:hypothetical protein K469DRAFT_805494 [Zopfia rhizophila CBS 207.26]|uniref:Secreted protein n=1 Tax=Zopfia rhizophila CBS 207.26 TaxID=1314779 RepID=A0A6A6EIY7_9PEZI|nr:hypothetical protein K469DRAFT_805494 [Zopfia rhizophila CBS 207.26]